ncbi:hypothetical protein C8F04DRAFT_1231168 [Mycena alexandri]|uniref:Uncharacterized protein n=1 Tax=Mycena alexandri TaxID=1745969 RepID=A0AAD6T8I3_9AGAR|nr:hypothetical protein C8F04DRAFT_1231168 [Mycena alexandri]
MASPILPVYIYIFIYRGGPRREQEVPFLSGTGRVILPTYLPTNFRSWEGTPKKELGLFQRFQGFGSTTLKVRPPSKRVLGINQPLADCKGHGTASCSSESVQFTAAHQTRKSDCSEEASRLKPGANIVSLYPDRFSKFQALQVKVFEGVSRKGGETARARAAQGTGYFLASIELLGAPNWLLHDGDTRICAHRYICGMVFSSA